MSHRAGVSAASLIKHLSYHGHKHLWLKHGTPSRHDGLSYEPEVTSHPKNQAAYPFKMRFLHLCIPKLSFWAGKSRGAATAGCRTPSRPARRTGSGSPRRGTHTCWSRRRTRRSMRPGTSS